MKKRQKVLLLLAAIVSLIPFFLSTPSHLHPLIHSSDIVPSFDSNFSTTTHRLSFSTEDVDNLQDEKYEGRSYITSIPNYFNAVAVNLNVVPCRPLTEGVLNGEVRHFMYFAVPRSGSSVTRNQLRPYCKSRQLRCAELSTCSNDAKRSYLKCAHSWNLSPTSIKRCCPMPWKEPGMCSWDALVDHFDVGSEELPYLVSQFPINSFRFGNLRDPINHFISWRDHRCRPCVGVCSEIHDRNAWYCEMKKDYGKYVDVIFDVLTSNTSNKKRLETAMGLTNAQARYFGFDGTEKSMQEIVFPIIKSLDFIILTDNLRKSWCILKQMLGWPEEFINVSIAHRSRLYEIRNETAEKIRKIQWADIQIHDYAKRLFEQLQDKYRKTCF